jgi:hypothetical protein
MNNVFKYFLILTALLTQPISYAGYDEAVAAAQKGDFQTAFKELKPLAEQGNVMTQ